MNNVAIDHIGYLVPSEYNYNVQYLLITKVIKFYAQRIIKGLQILKYKRTSNINSAR